MAVRHATGNRESVDDSGPERTVVTMVDDREIGFHRTGPERKAHVRMITRSSMTAVVAMAIACGGRPGEPLEEMVEGVALVASRIIAQGPVGGGPETELYRSQDIELIDDAIAVVDNGNDRIVLLDASLSPIWTTGRTGRGPGEFEGPVAVRETANGLIVVDIGNSRFTELDHSGALVRTFGSPHSAMTFGVRSDGAIVIPARLESHFAYVVGGESGAVPFAVRDTTFGGTDMFGQKDRPPHVAVTAGDTVHIFDETTLQLHKFDPSGERRLRLALPEAHRDSLNARSKATIESLARSGYRLVGITTGTLKATRDGRLLLLSRVNLTAGFVIDPHTYQAQRIVMPRDDTEWAPLKGTRSAVLAGSRLIVLHRDSVFVYELTAEGP